MLKVDDPLIPQTGFLRAKVESGQLVERAAECGGFLTAEDLLEQALGLTPELVADLELPVA